ncbi:MAG: hypothetical protein CMJ24_09080 [Phycisphaerae bacterium]|nr:hypothetical protein [Phycisphaerae bacterium]
MYELDDLTVRGDARSMGRQQGEALRDRVQSLLAHRMNEMTGYLSTREVDAMHRIDEVGRRCLDLLEAWDHEGWDEHIGVAEGARVDPAHLLFVLNMTDTRDLVCWGPEGDDEGCTAIGIPPSRTADSDLIMAQSWDLNRGDIEHVVAIHRLPTDGPETWTVTVAGGPTLIGMNEHGLWVGTTNLKTEDVQSGIGYMNLLHRAIRERTAQAAASVIESATRIAAHSYWLGDPDDAIQLECSSSDVVRRELGTEPIVQTNHCLDAAHLRRQPEPPSASSRHRFDRATSLVSTGGLDLEAIRTILSDRSEGALSISRHPEDGEPTTTNACVIGIPAERILEACRGPADQGRWIRLPFTRGG